MQRRASTNKTAKLPPAPMTGADRKEPLAYSDLDVSRWREYGEIETGSLWTIESRSKDNGHQLEYHGNCVPQILTQLLTRFTKAGDVVLDMFLGAGTSAIEAAYMGRRALGLELKPEMVDAVTQRLQSLGYATKGREPQALLFPCDSSDAERVDAAVAQALKGFQAVGHRRQVRERRTHPAGLPVHGADEPRGLQDEIHHREEHQRQREGQGAALQPVALPGAEGRLLPVQARVRHPLPQALTRPPPSNPGIF